MEATTKEVRDERSVRDERYVRFPAVLERIAVAAGWRTHWLESGPVAERNGCASVIDVAQLGERLAAVSVATGTLAYDEFLDLSTLTLDTTYTEHSQLYVGPEAPETRGRVKGRPGSKLKESHREQLSAKARARWDEAKRKAIESGSRGVSLLVDADTYLLMLRQKELMGSPSVLDMLKELLRGQGD